VLIGKESRGDYRTLDLDYVAVKSPQFSYSRIKGADPRSQVEMASTGEVAAFGNSYAEALLTSMLASGFTVPKKNIFISIGKEENKLKLLPSMRALTGMGFTLYATEHTADFLKEHGVPCEKVYKIHTGGEPNVRTLLSRPLIDLIVNIPTRSYERTKSLQQESQDGFTIRRMAVDLGIPLITNRQLAEAFIDALVEMKNVPLEARARDEYHTEL